MGNETVWDGEEYVVVTEEEAEKLEAEGKVQRVEQRHYSGHEMKTRAEFTGYKTREMRAEVNPPKSTPTPTPKGVEDEEKADDWKKHRVAAGKYLGKATGKVTKKETLEYMDL